MSPLPLTCPDIWARAREIAPRQTLESRADMLAANMARSLSDAGLDLLNRRHCEAWLSGLYAPADIHALLDRAIDEAGALNSEAAKLKHARAL